MLYDLGKLIYDTVGPLNLTLGTGVVYSVLAWRKELFRGGR